MLSLRWQRAFPLSSNSSSHLSHAQWRLHTTALSRSRYGTPTASTAHCCSTLHVHSFLPSRRVLTRGSATTTARALFSRQPAFLSCHLLSSSSSRQLASSSSPFASFASLTGGTAQSVSVISHRRVEQEPGASDDARFAKFVFLGTSSAAPQPFYRNVR